MDSTEDILNEMKEISPLLAEAVRVTPYTLPKGYFEGLQATVLQKIQDVPAVLPVAVDTYQVPENYFENLSGLILSKIQNSSGEIKEELEIVAPLLNTISKIPVFSLPDGYFEQLELAPKTNSESEQGQLVSIKNYRRWIQYAAAAMVAGILITGAFFFTDSNSYLEHEKKTNTEMRGLPDTSKDAGILKPDTDNNEEVADNNPKNMKEAEQEMKAERKSTPSKSALELLSDDELKHYLEENSIPEPIYPDNTEIEDSL